MTVLHTQFRLKSFEVDRCNAKVRLERYCPPEVEMQIVVHVNAKTAVQLLRTKGGPLTCSIREGFGDSHFFLSRESFVKAPDRLISHPSCAVNIDKHISESMLDGLKRANGAIKLSPISGVLRAHFHFLLCTTDYQ
jgi:hypothetical protein